MIRRGVRSSVAFGLLLASGLSLGGCRTSPSPTAASNDPATTIPRRPAEPRPGLVVERLRIRTDPGRLAMALASIPESDADPPESERWRREGFLIRVIDEDALAAFEATLAPEVVAVRTWHGEATGWRSCSRRRLPRGSVILLDGRARPVDDQLLTLAVRGWSVPLVDGAGLQFELVPHLEATTIDPLSPPPPPGEFRGVPLVPSIERVLGPDEVLLVASVPKRTAVAPSMSTDVADEAPAEGEDFESTPEEDSAPRGRSGPGPDGGLPPTLAASLVGEPVAGELGVLLIRGRPHPLLGLPTSESAN
jgi:hypothetical protein